MLAAFIFHLAGNADPYENLRKLRPDFIAWQNDVLSSKQHLGTMIALNVDLNAYRKASKIAEDVVGGDQNERANLLKVILTPPRHMYEGSQFWASHDDPARVLKEAQNEVNTWIQNADSAVTKLRQKMISFSETGLTTKLDALKAKLKDAVK